MPSVLVRLLLTVLLVWTMPSWANGLATDGALVLDSKTASFQISGPISTWIDTSSKATIADVASAPGNFKTTPALARQPIAIFDTLWIRLRVVLWIASAEVLTAFFISPRSPLRSA